MNYSIDWDGPGERDPIEGGQAECRHCGEWYRVTAPFVPHSCAYLRGWRAGRDAVLSRFGWKRRFDAGLIVGLDAPDDRGPYGPRSPKPDDYTSGAEAMRAAVVKMLKADDGDPDTLQLAWLVEALPVPGLCPADPAQPPA